MKDGPQDQVCRSGRRDEEAGRGGKENRKREFSCAILLAQAVFGSPELQGLTDRRLAYRRDKFLRFKEEFGFVCS